MIIKYLFILGTLSTTILCTTIVHADPISVERAFQLDLTRTSPTTLTAHFTIAPGTYLYQSKFTLTPPLSAHFAPFPQGVNYQDLDLGPQIIYKKSVSLPIAIKSSNPPISALKITYQGCSELGFCYPPQTQTFYIRFTNNAITNVSKIAPTTQDPQNPTQELTLPNTPKTIHKITPTHLIAWIFQCFIGGLLLCFTPCVLPMLPMLSTLIISKKHIKTKRAFILSFTYVLSMSITYAIVGMIAARLGQSLQPYFQSPWVLTGFASFFILLALKTSGHLKFFIPDLIGSHIYNLQTRSASGTIIGAISLGILATLVASPCVSAPLMGVLAYIAQTGSLLIGGIGLFALGFGMGTPLIIMGTLGGKFLPTTGKWMQIINELFAIVLFGFAIFIFDRFLPPYCTSIGLSLLALYIAYQLNSFHLHINGIGPRIGVLFIVYAAILLIGAVQGQPYTWRPFSAHVPAPLYAVQFQVMNSEKDLNVYLEKARKNQQPTLLKFYADWCGSCKSLDKKIFNDPQVQAALNDWDLIQVDVTKNTPENQALLKKFQLIGPPALLFFNRQGMKANQLVGDVQVDDFLTQLKKAE